MEDDSPINDICLDLSLSIGSTTRQAPVPPSPSVQPVTSEPDQQFMQLLMHSPPHPQSPTAEQPPAVLPELSLAPGNIDPFASHQPIIDMGDHSFINPWNGSTVVPPPPPPLHLSPPVITVPPVPPQPGNTRGPGRPPSASAAHHTRRRSSHAAAEEAAPYNEIVAPYPWATNRPAVVHNLGYLLSKNINVISGQFQCKRCERMTTMEYNLREKFIEVSHYIVENKEILRDRAPSAWMNPRLPLCETCETGMKPVLSEKKEEINWLFLLLGQLLGCCTLEQLRYFCDKTRKHRTGAKDRVLYLSYLALCKQLDPYGPFDR